MFWTSCKFFAVLAFLTGCIYPLLITVIAGLTMPLQANGSLLIVNGQIRGSALIAQPFAGEKYFWPRPSAVGYNPLHSGGSNLASNSKELKKRVQERALKFSQGIAEPASVPADLVYASGSGLDPHITADGAYFQLDRVAKARGLSSSQKEELRQLIDRQKEANGGILGPQYVNVLKLNLQTDQHFPVVQP